MDGSRWGWVARKLLDCDTTWHGNRVAPRKSIMYLCSFAFDAQTSSAHRPLATSENGILMVSRSCLIPPPGPDDKQNKPFWCNSNDLVGLYGESLTKPTAAAGLSLEISGVKKQTLNGKQARIGVPFPHTLFIFYKGQCDFLPTLSLVFFKIFPRNVTYFSRNSDSLSLKSNLV